MGLLREGINCPCDGLDMSGSSAPCLLISVLGLYVEFQPVYSHIKIIYSASKTICTFRLKELGKELSW